MGQPWKVELEISVCVRNQCASPSLHLAPHSRLARLLPHLLVTPTPAVVSSPSLANRESTRELYSWPVLFNSSEDQLTAIGCEGSYHRPTKLA